MNYTSNLLDLIGNTPLLRLTRLGHACVFAKAEYLNPGGSIKDRVAKHIIETAEKAGELKEGMTIAEATSGNTGIGVTLVGVHKGYRVQVFMPEDMSEERKKIIRALGGELVETPQEDGIQGAVDRLEEIAKENPSLWLVNQFANPLNPEIHYMQTGPELWSEMEGNIDAFVAGVGSGGTIGGVGKYLKEQKPDVRIVAVEPKNSAALLGHEPGLHKIQGIGDGFVPPVLDTSLIDDVLTVTDEEAIDMARELARLEGALVGTSSGANVWASLKVAEEMCPDCMVATVLADRVERYFSTSLI